MLIPDHERCCSPHWRLDRLKKAVTRHEATDYLADYWTGWIAMPMRGPIPQGGWAQVTLGCLAVEACAWFLRPYSSWAGVEWPHTTKKPLIIPRSQGAKPRSLHEQLNSEAAFCWVFRHVFNGYEPQGLSIEKLAEVTYTVFRCSLAHRGLSKDCADSDWLGVIDGQPTVFRHLTNGKEHALSIEPGQFVERIDAWFGQAVLLPLSVGGNSDVDKAFKEWCGERWQISETQWGF
jgi:hypothetical protein